MATCTIDSESFPAFRRCLKELTKKFRKAEGDFAQLVSEVQKDYKSACNAFCVPMPSMPDLQRRVWKYDFKSSDLKKHPRDCFRFVGLLDSPDSDPAIMRALFCYFKGDRENISPKEIQELAKRLKAGMVA